MVGEGGWGGGRWEKEGVGKNGGSEQKGRVRRWREVRKKGIEGSGGGKEILSKEKEGGGWGRGRGRRRGGGCEGAEVL